MRLFGRKVKAPSPPTCAEADAAIEVAAASEELERVRREGVGVRQLADDVRRAAAQVTAPAG